MTFDQFLREACPPLDLEWRKYRRRSARHRVDGRLRELGVDSYGDYLEILRSDPWEAAQLPDLMRVTVSRFFREGEAWQEAEERILPGLVAENPDAGRLLAWSAGSCGGEEPFSLALLWLEYLLPLHPAWSMEIIATDIDAASLQRARSALYRGESLREVPRGICERWFSREDAMWRLHGKARALVRFEERNLLTAPPPQGVDLLLCRYLAFTYYTGERLQAAAQRLWEALRPGGFLMIGAKEHLPEPALELFEPIPGSRVFCRRRG
ncbi:MAG TPA: CheR family methyltransferase [Geobacteraceae bacterium]